MVLTRFLMLAQIRYLSHTVTFYVIYLSCNYLLLVLVLVYTDMPSWKNFSPTVLSI
jgi:hypothetical protein